METFVFGQFQPSDANQTWVSGPLIPAFVLVVAALLFVYYIYWDRKQAKENYGAAYAKFEANPGDVSLRDKALAKADAYAKAMGGYKSDQQMHATSLKQSIEAMHRAAKQNTQPTERLRELQSMLDEKLISDEEFQAKRQEILQSV